MNQAVLEVPGAGYLETVDVVVEAWPSLFDRVQALAPARDVVILGVILSILQVADGVLTGMGIYHFGVEAEGNLFLRGLMYAFGPYTALIAAKVSAILIVASMCLIADRVKWVPLALKMIIGVYLLAAIIPWTIILIQA